MGDHFSGIRLTAYLMQPTRRFLWDEPPQCALFGLAPGGVCQAADIAARAGGLLHHRFTLTPEGAIHFSVALSVGLPRPVVNWHRALWRADFPQQDELAAIP